MIKHPNFFLFFLPFSKKKPQINPTIKKANFEVSTSVLHVSKQMNKLLLKFSLSRVGLLICQLLDYCLIGYFISSYYFFLGGKIFLTICLENIIPKLASFGNTGRFHNIYDNEEKWYYVQKLFKNIFRLKGRHWNNWDSH